MDLASIERGLDDEAYGLLSRPSSSMSASRGGAGGESSSRLSRGGVDSVVSTSASSVNGRVVYIPFGALRKTCCGAIGTSSRFCTELMVEGEVHCGTSSHSKKVPDGTVKENHYYPPGGIAKGRHTARYDVSVSADNIPNNLVEVFTSGGERRDWSHLIIDAAVPDPEPVFKQSDRVSDTSSYDSRQKHTTNDINNEDTSWEAISELNMEEFKSEFNYLQFKMGSEEFTAQWDSKEVAENPLTPIVKHNSSKLQSIGLSLSQMSKQTPSLAKKLNEEYLPSVNQLVKDMDQTQDLRGQLGDLSALVYNYGSVASGVNESLRLSKESARKGEEGITHANEVDARLQEHINQVGKDKDDTLRVVAKVARNNATRSGLIEDRVSVLEEQRRHRMIPEEGTTETVHPTSLSVEDQINALLDGKDPNGAASSSSAAPALSPSGQGLTMSTIIGQFEQGGVPQDISVNVMMAEIESLKALIKALSQSQAGGNSVVFDNKLAFNTEAQCLKWYVLENPSGKAMCAFVDLNSIWLFAAMGQTSESDYIQLLHKSTAIGLRGNLEASYAASFANRYPKEFVGDKKIILPSEVIAMFSSIEAYRGLGIGDGLRERMLNSLRLALQRHRTYCDDNLPSGTLREHAIRSGEITVSFFHSLVQHFDDQIGMLTSIGLPEKEVSLLLSNQTTQLCDDLYAFRQLATNVDTSNRTATAARYFWVTLLAHGKMQEYLKNGIKNSPGIQGSFVRFLTRMSAKTSASDLKTKVEKVGTDLKKFENYTKTELGKLDSSLQNVVKANQLKRK